HHRAYAVGNLPRDVARVERALRVADDVHLLRLRSQKHVLDEREQLGAARERVVEGIDLRDPDVVAVVFERFGDTVEVIERADVLDPGEAVREHDRIRFAQRRAVGAAGGKRRRRARAVYAAVPGGRLHRRAATADRKPGNEEERARSHGRTLRADI